MCGHSLGSGRAIIRKSCPRGKSRRSCSKNWHATGDDRGLADEGKKQIDVWKLWLEKINAAGGFKVGGKNMSIEMIQYDYQTDGKRAQQLAEKLITDDKVDVLMAPFGSGHTKIIAGVAERYQVPVLALCLLYFRL